MEVPSSSSASAGGAPSDKHNADLAKRTPVRKSRNNMSYFCKNFALYVSHLALR